MDPKQKKQKLSTSSDIASPSLSKEELREAMKKQNKADLNRSIEDPAEGSTRESSGIQGPEPMDVAGSKRLTEPFFLKKILLEKPGDTSELTTLAMSVHAVMLESGFLLLDHGSDKFSFSKELSSVSLRYTLSELITPTDTNTIESVTLKFESLGRTVVVYGTLGGPSGRFHRVCLDKHRFVPVIDLVKDTLKYEKQGSSSVYRKVFIFWRMVKDGLAFPLLIGLCDKAGLELPPCLMRLPTELKLKILESLPAVSIAKMACLCTELRHLASDNDLWKQKCLEEAKNLVVTEASDSVNWKAKFAAFRFNLKEKYAPFLRQNQPLVPIERRNFPIGRSGFRFPPMIRDPSPWFNGDRWPRSIDIHPGQPARGSGGQPWGRSYTPRRNYDKVKPVIFRR